MSEPVEILVKQIQAHADAMAMLFSKLGLCLPNMKKATLPEVAADYVLIKGIDDLFGDKGLPKDIGAIKNELSQKIIPEMFDAQQVTSFNTKSGYRVTVSQATRCTMTDKLQGAQWLKDNGLGAIVTETVNSSTLSATARTLLEDGKELPQEYFNTFLQPSTSVTKVKPKA